LSLTFERSTLEQGQLASFTDTFMTVTYLDESSQTSTYSVQLHAMIPCVNSYKELQNRLLEFSMHIVTPQYLPHLAVIFVKIAVKWGPHTPGKMGTRVPIFPEK